VTAPAFAVAARQTKAFSYRGNGRFAQSAFTDGARLLFPVLLPFLNFSGKLQLLAGYEPELMLYKQKNGERLPFLYIFRNKKARKIVIKPEWNIAIARKSKAMGFLTLPTV
jgi:hypothetical protein